MTGGAGARMGATGAWMGAGGGSATRVFFGAFCAVCG